MQIQNSFKEELVFLNTDLVQSNHTKHKPWFMVCRILILIYLLKKILLLRIVLNFFVIKT